MSDDALTIVLARRVDVEQQLGHLERGVLFTPCPDPPPQPLEELDVVVLVGGTAIETRARVVQVMPPSGVALECAASESLRQQLQSAVAAWVGDHGGSYAQWGRVEMPDGQQAYNEDTPADTSADDDRDLPLADRVKTMSTAEKRQLALHGDKTARTLLLKDPNKNIHSFVIRNKRITIDEVRYIAGFRQANPDVLKQIGENREWVQNPRILMALVTNPKTPGTIATKLLARLPNSEVRRLAKSSSVPRAVSAAARRIVAS